MLSTVFALGAVAAVVIVGALVALAYALMPDDPHAGDCVHSQTSLTVTDCDSGDAKGRVVGILDPSDTTGCSYVAGADRADTVPLDDGQRIVCTGPKDADPATSANVVLEGQCVDTPDEAAEHARIVDCHAPGAHKVLRLIRGPVSADPNEWTAMDLTCLEGQSWITWSVGTLDRSVYTRGACLEGRR